MKNPVTGTDSSNGVTTGVTTSIAHQMKPEPVIFGQNDFVFLLKLAYFCFGKRRADLIFVAIGAENAKVGVLAAKPVN